MPNVSADQTAVARAATLLSEQFELLLGGLQVTGDVARKPRVMEPGGVSTMGGRQSRQPIVLDPLEPGGTAVTVGWVDVNHREAKLRSFSAVSDACRLRSRDLPVYVDRQGYQEFLEQSWRFFKMRGFRIGIESMLRSTPAPSSRPRRHRTRWFWLGLVVLAMLVALFWWKGVPY